MNAAFGGVLLGVGILLVLDALRRPSLDRIIRRHGPSSEVAPGRLVDVITGRLGGVPSDLLILGLSARDHVTRRLVFLACGVVGPFVLLGLGPYVGFRISGTSTIVLFTSSFAVGHAWPEWRLKSRAREARTSFRSSLSAYLDLVAIQLAGGSGMDTAFVAAGRVGDGPAFASIAAALEERRVTREPLWTVFADLGDRLEITELTDLASSVKLGGDHGARLTASLVARARALRHRQMSEVEAKANASTERMGLPMVAIFLGFLVLLGYPALDLINNGFA